MTFELLVDAGPFWSRLKEDIQAADERVWLQMLSFEADAAGRPLADLLLKRTDLDRRVIADAFFTQHFINDAFVHALSNRTDPDLQAERRATTAMLAELDAAGVTTRLSHPAGPLLWKAPHRGHKKILIVDDVAYLGGFNFSEHNFAWHDLMVRITDPALVDHLVGDFQGTWQGQPSSGRTRSGNTTVHSLDGRGNPDRYQPLLDAIAACTDRVDVVSPYLSPPFTDAIGSARANGADVHLLTPEANNWPLFRTATLHQARRRGYTVHLYPGRMNHTKAILLDEETLILGSSNFDMFSYWLHDEILLSTTDPQLVEPFQAELLAPDQAASHAPGSWPSHVAGHTAQACLSTIFHTLRGYAALAHAGERRLVPPARS